MLILKVKVVLEVDLTDKGFDALKAEENKYLKSAINGYLHQVTDKPEVTLLDTKII